MTSLYTWGHRIFFMPVQTTRGFFTCAAIATVLFVALMWSLHQLSPRAKKWMMIICTFVAGLYFLLEFLLPTKFNTVTGQEENIITPTVQGVSNYFNYIFVWMALMGLFSLGIVHGRRLIARAQGWHNSLAFFLALIAMLVAGFLSKSGDITLSDYHGFSFALHNAMLATYNTLFNGLLVNLDSAMFALLAFYIASAAYRAFRIRTVEAALLMFSALIVMLGMVNIGMVLTSWIPTHLANGNPSPWAFFRIERFSLWMLSWINMPTQRAVGIGVAVGGLAMAMRLWLSLERGAFFSQE